ncbi:hypothetical protein GGX14DRAFT_542529 [Mycena pura]|uniref:Uncharacterized protein n=1 Tax=Mycena pura TaxID=153505 RepID=A0AAD6VHW8_9AGAR|nr:hypothetical protein GGX14DRAFT_542529 [Mycena pura]
MPAQLPQELLDLIIGHVHDKPTLKSCALTSRFRTPSQRGLFSSFRISLSTAPTTSYWVVSDFFLQFPRFAGYVKTLTVEFPLRRSPAATAADVSALRSLLDRLERVHQCTLDGGIHRYSTTWGSPFCAPILDFIQRQDLLELHIRSLIHIPHETLAAFFCAAPTLGLHNAEFIWDLPQSVYPDLKAEHLRLTRCSSALDTLRQGHFVPLTANVRRMWITMGTQNPTFKLAPELAARLEYLRVDWPSSYPLEKPMDPTELFAALRTLDLSPRSFDRDVEPCDVAIFAPLFSCTTAALAEIRFSYTLGSNVFRKYYLHADTLEAIAAALEKCPGTPRIRWYFSVDGRRSRKEYQLVKFTALLQAGLPHVHEQGRLYVQNRSRLRHRYCLPCGCGQAVLLINVCLKFASKACQDPMACQWQRCAKMILGVYPQLHAGRHPVRLGSGP